MSDIKPILSILRVARTDTDEALAIQPGLLVDGVLISLYTQSLLPFEAFSAEGNSVNRKEDFVYVILLLIERAEAALTEQDLLDQMEVIQSRRFTKEGLRLASVVHHVLILNDAGFIKIESPRGFAREITRLTWDGHEYLASLKKLYGGSPLEG